MKTILIQGAIPGEIESYLNFYKNLKQQKVDGFDFWVGKYKDVQIVISLTDIGVMNATESTVIAAYEFKPDVVINQGTCGGHLNSLKVGDLIVAEDAVYMNKFRSPAKKEGEGSNALEWVPVLKGCFRVKATDWLVELAKSVTKGENVYFGTIGTGDMFSQEIDRIKHLRELFGEICEDMETLASYKVCENFNIPHIAIRVISNNETVKGLGTRRDNMNVIIPKITNFITTYIDEIIKNKNIKTK